MPLAKTIVSVPLSAGVDTKTDSKQVGPGKLLTLENGVFTSPGKARKRNGYTVMPLTVDTGNALATYGDELLTAGANTLYSYDSGQNTWRSKGTLTSVAVTQKSIAKSTYSIYGQDGAAHVASGLQCFVWEEWNSFGGTYIGAYYSVVDTTTGQTIVANTSLGATTFIAPKVLTCGSQFVILMVKTSDTRIYGATISTAAPTSALSFTALTALGAGGLKSADAGCYDATMLVTGGSTYLYLAFCDTTFDITTNRYLAGSLFSVVNTVTTAIGTSTPTGPRTITIFAELNQAAPVIAWCYAAAADGVGFNALAANLGSSLSGGNKVVEAALTLNAGFITGVSLTAASISFRIFYTEIGLATPATSTTRNAPITGGGYVVGSIVGQRGVGLVGKAFSYNSIAYAPVGYTSVYPNSGTIALQATNFVIDSAGNVAARYFQQSAGGSYVNSLATAYSGGTTLPESVPLSASSWLLPSALTIGTYTGSTGVGVEPLTGLSAVTVNFAVDYARNYSRTTLANDFHISGGFLWMYDGIAPTEHGFHLYPDPVTNSASGSGGAMLAGTYGYVFCYEWTDGQGLIHRSTPSVAVSVTTTGTASSNTLTIPTLRLTTKTGVHNPVRIVGYRTLANGSIYYRLGSVTNDVTIDTVTFADGQVDTAISTHPQLYTTGNVLQNGPIGPPGMLCIHRNRLWALDSTNPYLLWPSKEIALGAPVEFSASLYFNVNQVFGGATAIASMDDKLIIWTQTAILAVTGRGPDSTGGQNDWSDAQLVTTDVGCSAPRSVVMMPQGLMFKSLKGIYLLGRDLSVSYIGSDVEAYNALTITSAQLLASVNQVRFTASSGSQILVYDYFVRQWSVFTMSASASDSTVWQGLYVWTTPGGTQYRESTTLFTDDGTFVRLKLVTPWLSFAGLQGFQRVYKALLLGEYASASQLTMTVAVDFNSTVVQTITVTASATAPYQWRFDMARQKCEAVQLTLIDVNSGTPGESLSLSALLFEVGIKPGPFRPPSGSSTG